uniref:Uncharacterized protein n=1 Tax=Elaeophora elaphi TaxID=1147741 RepID=A0A0R3RVS3_9BILA
MNSIIVDLVKFLVFTLLIFIYIGKLSCTVIFPTVNAAQFRRNLRISNNTDRMVQFNKLGIYAPKQFGILTKRKSVRSVSTVNSCILRNCQQKQKNREQLKIGQENFSINKLPNDSNEQLQLRKVGSGKYFQLLLKSFCLKETSCNAKCKFILGSNKQLPIQLSLLVRSAADMLKLFQTIAIQEQNPNYVKQIVRRRQPMESLAVAAGEFQPGRKVLPIKSLIASNLDHMPTATHKGNLRTEDTTWAQLLFGPHGVLTAVFHVLDDRRKITGKIGDRTTISKNSNDNSQTTGAYHQSDLSLLPDFLVDAKPIDFAKIFEAFLTGSKGNFDERIFNLPEILGICNRLSCGDIYKAIDKFRKSEFFINFQTALQLVQDPKGWEILGDLISNPDLIAQFISGAGSKGDRSGVKNLLGSFTRAEKSSKNNSKEIGPEDGDFGIDFSKMVKNGHSGEFRKPKKPVAEELPEIAENIDGVDYYNAVESGTDIDGVETIAKPDVDATTETTTTASSIQTAIPRAIPDTDLILPNIFGNIDHIGKTRIIIDATTPIPAKILNCLLLKLSVSGKSQKVKANINCRNLALTFSRQTIATLRRLLRPDITTTYKPLRKQIITSTISVITRYPGKTAIRSTPTTTTKNFREDSDYYAMYYDDMRG